MSAPNSLESLESRCHFNGSVNGLFGSRALIIENLSATVMDVAAGPRGKIWAIIQPARVRSDTPSELVCFDASGSRDSGFGVNGSILTLPRATDVTPLSNGKVLVASSDLRLQRFNLDGSLDLNFGIHGTEQISPLNRITGGKLFTLSDGDIIATDYRSVHSSALWDVFRLSSDGKVDNGFGNGGRLSLQISGQSAFTYPSASNSVQFEICPRRAGGIIATAAGLGGVSSIILDKTGHETTEATYSAPLPPYFINSAVPLRDGSDAVAATLGPDAASYFLLHLRADGTLDESYGRGGTRNISFPHGEGGYGSFDQAILARDGSSYLVGNLKQFPNSSLFISHLDSGGIIDRGFGDGGMIIEQLGMNDGHATSLTFGRDDALILSGNFSNQSEKGFFILRFHL